MKIHGNKLNTLSLIYLSIPLCIFLVFWLNPIYSAISISALIYILIYNYKQGDKNKSYYEISKTVFIITILTGFIWCLLAGIGNIVYQYGPDWNPKNAIMHDLIKFSWPVIYKNGSALTYYFGISLPSALFGKFVSSIGFNDLCAFKSANIFALFWTTAGISLIAFNLYSLINIDKKKFLIFILFIFFSGMDILLIKENYFTPPDYMIDWHSSYSYPANTSQLFFNHLQCIAPWLVISLFLKNCRNYINFGIYSAFILFYSPLAFIGAVFYFIIITFIDLFNTVSPFVTNSSSPSKSKSIEIFKEIFSINNFLSILCIFSVIYLFFRSNHNAVITHLIKPDISNLLLLFIFWEALIFILLQIYNYKKNIVFWIMTGYLIIIPFCKFSAGESDFYMRSAIPSLFILSVFTIKTILENNTDSKFSNICKKLTIFCYILGAITPITIIYGIIYYSYHNTQDEYIRDLAKTMNNKISEKDCGWVYDIGDYCNYGSTNVKDYIFWKYIAANRQKS